MSANEVIEAIETMTETEVYVLGYHCCRRIQLLTKEVEKEVMSKGMSIARFCKIIHDHPELKGKANMRQVVLVFRACNYLCGGRLEFFVRSTPESELPKFEEVNQLNLEPIEKGGRNGTE